MLLSLFGAVSLLACNQPPPKAGSGAGDASASVDAEGDAESCKTLASKLCERAGSESSTCASVEKTTELLSPKACAAGLADIEYALARVDEAGKVCTELSARLCKDLGPETETCKMVETETPRMPPEQCEAMTEQYEQVLAELVQMEQRNKPLEADKAAKIAAGDVPSYGPADAQVTVVEFSDFQCPYCSLAANAVNELKDKYGDRVRFVFRQYPLGFHEQAHLAAQASLAAHAQGKFWEFHDKLFANQKALGRAELEQYAEEIGLDMAQFRKALDEGTYKATVDADMELGGEVFVSGTPTMFINGARVANATDVESISSEIDKALEAKP
ncbi:MAG: thioredoxin domain-containing protein [Enhygromyxa sp.]